MNDIIIINQEQLKKCPINDSYYIGKEGQVYSLKAKRYLSWSFDKDGYPRIDLRVEGKQKHFKVHRLVWITWNGNVPTNLQENHKNDDKLDPSLNNLYMGTQKENIKDCIKNNTRVGHTWSLCVFDKEVGKTVIFCPAGKFIEYSGHSCASGSIVKMMGKNWFKKRYNIIYYKQVQNVTTMADECKPVE